MPTVDLYCVECDTVFEDEYITSSMNIKEMECPDCGAIGLEKHWGNTKIGIKVNSREPWKYKG